MWVELTELQTNSKVTVNFYYVESYVKAGDETKVVFSGTSYLVKESYEDIKKHLDIKAMSKELRDALYK